MMAALEEIRAFLSNVALIKKGLRPVQSRG